MKRILRFFEILWIMRRDVWTITENPELGVHWHLANFATQQQYQIIFKHLHTAHLAYDAELAELRRKTLRSIKAHLAKRDAHGRFIRKGRKR